MLAPQGYVSKTMLRVFLGAWEPQAGGLLLEALGALVGTNPWQAAIQACGLEWETVRSISL